MKIIWDIMPSKCVKNNSNIVILKSSDPVRVPVLSRGLIIFGAE